MQEVLHGCSHLNIKEINLLLRDYVMKYGYDSINYTSFADDLYDVRFELAKSRLMDINVKKLPVDYFLKSGKPVEGESKMQIKDVSDILYCSKELLLTPAQINILLGQAIAYDDGTIDALQFGEQLQANIERMFSTEALRRKAQLVQLGVFKPDQVQMPEYEDLDLFKVFRDYDENDKGFLEPLEFKHCLSKFESIDLSSSAVITITQLADIDGNQRIDYQEFMKHFKSMLYLVLFHAELQALYDEEISNLNLTKMLQ